MTATQPDVAAIEQLLASAFGRSITISACETFGFWAVVRCAIEDAVDGVPSSVVVKWLRDHPTGFRTDPAQVLTDVAANEFLVDLGVDLAPQLLASDVDAGVVVLEDLSPRVPLLDLLRARAVAGQLGLQSFASDLGDLHARTIGHEDTYYARRRALGPVDRHVERMRFFDGGSTTSARRWAEIHGFVESWGVELATAADRDMAAVLQALDEPGPFLAFSSGDAGVNNYLVDPADASRGRFIDFEFAGYRHALTDASCLYVPPPAWMAVTDPTTDGTEDAYRLALVRAVREAEDDATFGFGLGAACLAAAIMKLPRLSKLDARPPGENSRAQLVTALEASAHVASDRHVLPDLAGWTIDVAAMLRRRWPDADGPPPPAYTPRGG